MIGYFLIRKKHTIGLIGHACADVWTGFGFGPSRQAWISHIYRGFRASFTGNGYLSESLRVAQAVVAGQTRFKESAITDEASSSN
jgi:hypothetical protein